MKDGRFLSSVSFVSVVDAMISLRCSSKANSPRNVNNFPSLPIICITASESVCSAFSFFVVLGSSAGALQLLPRFPVSDFFIFFHCFRWRLIWLLAMLMSLSEQSCDPWAFPSTNMCSSLAIPCANAGRSSLCDICMSLISSFISASIVNIFSLSLLSLP